MKKIALSIWMVWFPAAVWGHHSADGPLAYLDHALGPALVALLGICLAVLFSIARNRGADSSGP